jgi:hypothetical protein
VGSGRAAAPHLAGELAQAAGVEPQCERLLCRASPPAARVLRIARRCFRQRGRSAVARRPVPTDRRYTESRLASADEASHFCRPSYRITSGRARRSSTRSKRTATFRSFGRYPRACVSRQWNRCSARSTRSTFYRKAAISTATRWNGTTGRARWCTGASNCTGSSSAARGAWRTADASEVGAILA